LIEEFTDVLFSFFTETTSKIEFELTALIPKKRGEDETLLT
jgi:hypothetical protein